MARPAKVSWNRITLETLVRAITHTDCSFQGGQLLIVAGEASWVCDLGRVICFWELHLPSAI